MRCAHGEKTQCSPASRNDRRHPPGNKSDAAKRQDGSSGGGVGSVCVCVCLGRGLPRDAGLPRDVLRMCEQVLLCTQKEERDQPVLI